MRVVYMIYGAIVLGMFAAAEYRGWWPTPTDQLRGVPPSVRSNPGSYRSVYSGYRSYSGGK
jgi:hypothetical protein